MRRALLLAFLTSTMVTAGVVAQFPQERRIRDRINQSIKGATEREQHDRQLEDSGRIPEPKATVINVDVQMVLSKGEYKTFAEAKAAEVKKIVDGEPLWLYLRFRSRLGDYVVTTRDTADNEKLRYTLFAEIAPRGDITALHQYAIRFSKDELAATELKINLAPGVFGRNKSIPVFLMASGNANTGVWNNEFRLTNNISVPRSLTDNLASAALTIDLANGAAKYRKMESDYASLMLRGTTDVTRLPVGGTFYSDALLSKVAEKLASENIKPVKVYFSGDDWQEIASFGPPATKIKRIFAAFTYRHEDECLYGVAEIIENYDFTQSKYDDVEIRLQKDLRVPCTEI